MSRRSRKHRNSQRPNLPLPLIFGVIGLVIVGFFIKNTLTNDSIGSFTGVTKLPATDYIENGLAYRNNEYYLEGKVTEKPESDTRNGQLVFVRLLNEEGSEPIDVSIKVPNNVGKINLETKHDYAFKVEVIQRGFLLAKDFKPL